MWIELTENCLSELRDEGWSVTHGKGNHYLVAPNGTRYPLSKSRGATNLYICHASGTTLFKVGIAEKPKTRLRTLQTGSSHRLEMICTVEVPLRSAEAQAHGLLDYWREHGEWFDLGSRAEQFIRALKDCRTEADLMAVFATLKENELAIRLANVWQTGKSETAKPA